MSGVHYEFQLANSHNKLDVGHRTCSARSRSTPQWNSAGCGGQTNSSAMQGQSRGKKKRGTSTRANDAQVITQLDPPHSYIPTPFDPSAQMDYRCNDSQQHNNPPPQLTATQFQSDSQSSTHHSNFTGPQLTKYDTWPTQGYDDEVDEDRQWGMGFQGDDAGVNDSLQQWQMPQHMVPTDSYTGDNYSSRFDCSQHPPPNILPPFDCSQYPSQYMPPNTQQAINYPSHSTAPNTHTTLYSAHPSQYLPPGSQPFFDPSQHPSQNMDPDAQLSFNIPHNGHILSQSTTSPTNTPIGTHSWHVLHAWCHFWGLGYRAWPPPSHLYPRCCLYLAMNRLQCLQHLLSRTPFLPDD